jgi:Cu-Zn family superoxide dismutase
MRVASLLMLVVVAGCAQLGRAIASLPSSPTPSTATATIIDPVVRQIGTVTFTDTPNGLLIAGSVSGLGVGGHGMHLHQVGRCDPPFASAGPHFNPSSRQHGFKNPSGAHAGDLPNLITPAAGAHRFEVLAPGVFLSSLLDADGAALIIHSGTDDHLTDPSGGSGGPIACGLIVRR